MNLEIAIMALLVLLEFFFWINIQNCSDMTNYKFMIIRNLAKYKNH